MNKTSPLIRILLLLSVIINIGAGVYIARKNSIDKKKKSAVTIFKKYTFNRDQLYKVLAVHDSDFVFIGDSQIQKFNLSEFLGKNNLKNRGIDGDFCGGVYDRLNDVLTGHPAKLFIEVGVNDIKRKAPADTAISFYNKIAQKTKSVSPGTKIYFISVLPSKVAENAAVISYNNGLKGICDKSGATFIDAYPEFNNNGQLKPAYDCGDGIHLSGQGYIALSSLIKPYL